MRSGGYKCYNYQCDGRVGESSLCGEPGKTALCCVDRVASSQTNADRIRAMTDEELTVFLDEFSGRCAECENDKGNTSCPIYCGGVFCLPSDIMNWLRQPAKED